jgi:hypothetical protein
LLHHPVNAGLNDFPMDFTRTDVSTNSTLKGELRKFEASIIISVLRDVAGLEVTLKSLTEDCRGFPVEVIVANDGADVGIRAVATRYGARVIDIPVSAGSYAARNGGLACAVADSLLFLDANVCVVPGWYRGCLRLCRR